MLPWSASPDIPNINGYNFVLPQTWHQHEDSWAAPATPPLWLPFSLLGSPSCALSWEQCLHKARGTAPWLAWSGLGTEHLGDLVLPRCPRAAAAALCPVPLRNMICFAGAGNKLSRELRGALIKLAYAGGQGEC